MLKIRHAASILPALLLAILGLAACPAAKHAPAPSAGQSVSVNGASQAAPPEIDLAPALAYIREALQQPTQDKRPPLGPAWNALARLAETPQAGVLEPLSDLINEQAQAAGDTAPQPLVGAWLAVEPTAAQAYVHAKLNAGQYTYLQSLANTPDLLRKELGQLDPAKLPLDCALLMLEQLRRIGVTADDARCLKALAQRSEPQVRLRAIGYLKALGACTSQQEEELLAAAASEDQQQYVPALEGVKCSGAEEYAKELVPLVVQAAMGDEDANAAKEPRVLYAVYALAYLPGEQASLMRNKLLGARDPQVRWQARLGELLHGQPSYWNDAMDVFGCANKDLWIALQPPEAVAMDLLPTYTQAVAVEETSPRVRAAEQLARYAIDGRPAAVALLVQLAADSEPQVAAAAFESGAQLGSWELAPAAQAALANEELPWETRLAAAGCLLSCAPAGGADEEQP